MNSALKASSSFSDSIVKCWLCGGTSCNLIKAGISAKELLPSDFAITDSHYGKTLDIYKCKNCDFRFCPEAGDVTSHYKLLQDAEYERTREQRAIQARKILAKVQRYKRSGALLDIGAGSGILVEQAIEVGYEATGIEPSKWLVEQAGKRSLPVMEGVFPSEADKASGYDIITLVDVLEHVCDPLQLMQDIAARLKDDGIAVIVTPDVGSLWSRVLKNKWWHYRVAHIGYFEKKTISLVCNKAGLKPIAWCRPAWFFSLDYLLIRLGQYIPLVARLAKFNFTKRVTIPLNLYDSWMVVARRDI